MTEPAALRASIEGPWGPIHVAATARGILAVAWLTTESAFDADVVRRVGLRVVDAGETGDEDLRQGHLRAAVDALEGVMNRRPAPPGLRFDLADRPAWDRHVLAAVALVPWGATVSYGEIARRVGAPRAARAVGGAVGRNPIGLLIPCHRVIAADGSLGGYGGDAWGGREERLAIKRDLLLREGVAVLPPGR
jgi:O-6-methylguanine DNA methyltransferase